MTYLLHLLVYLNIYGILAMSLNIIVGYCGMLTMAHAGYFAVGCYTYALFATKLGWEFLPAAVAGFCLSAVFSLAISIPAWRFRGDSFVLISLAVQQLLFSGMHNWNTHGAEPGTWANLTNGSFGLSSIPKPTIFGYAFSSLESIALLSAGMFLFVVILSRLLLTSPWGRLLKAMRDDELAARSLGKNVRLAKLQAMALSCGLAALAGSLYAAYVSYIDPTSASLDDSVLILCMVLVGGVGNLKGPLIGAFVLILIPELLRFVHIPGAVEANMRLIVYGVLLVLMMRLRPQGLAGALKV